MIAMQRVQPEIKKLQAKYKNDRQKLNEEMMKFYKENKINPLGGCLPLLAQMPIFIALFRALRDPRSTSRPTRACTRTCATRPAASCARSRPAPRASTTSSSWGWTSSCRLSTPTAARSNAAPYFLLVGLVILTGFAADPAGPEADPGREQADGHGDAGPARVLRADLLQFPAGLVLYFFVSNLWRLGQQEVIFRKHGSALHPPKGAISGSQGDEGHRSQQPGGRGRRRRRRRARSTSRTEADHAGQEAPAGRSGAARGGGPAEEGAGRPAGPLPAPAAARAQRRREHAGPHVLVRWRFERSSGSGGSSGSAQQRSRNRKKKRKR